MTTIYLPFNSRDKLDSDITRTYSCAMLKVVKLPSKGHCLSHAVLFKSSAIKNLLNLVTFEVLNNIEYYGAFLNFTGTDLVVELDSYISVNQYSSGTNHVVLLALGNALSCRITLLKRR